MLSSCSLHVASMLTPSLISTITCWNALPRETRPPLAHQCHTNKPMSRHLNNVISKGQFSRCGRCTHLGQEEESNDENNHVHLLELFVQVLIEGIQLVEKKDDQTDEPLEYEWMRVCRV